MTSDHLSDTLATMTSRRSFLKTLAGAGAAVALVPALGLVSPVVATSTDSRIVNTDGARLRSGPGTGYSIVATLAKGMEVRYLAYGGSANGYIWHKVLVLATGKQGYIAANLLSMPGNGPTNPDNQAGNYATTTAAVNFRTEPSTSSAIIQVIPAGTRVQVLHTQAGDFINVNYNTRQGWVHKAFLRF